MTAIADGRVEHTAVIARHRSRRRWLHALGPEGVLALIVTAALLGRRLWPGNAYDVRFDERLLGLSGDHPLGTDQFGRDILARLIAGARLTLSGAFVALLLTSGGGLLLGATVAIAGGWVDTVAGRLLEILLALPSLVVALALIAVFGPSFRSLLISLALANIPWYARVYRSLVLKERQALYVATAFALGAPPWRVAWREIAPNIAGPALVVATTNLGRVILGLAALSFLGLGAQAPAAEWGVMINEARPFFQSHIGLVLAPGAAITLTVVSINLLGDSLRDLLDPRDAR